jgi:hypothetical protein
MKLVMRTTKTTFLLSYFASRCRTRRLLGTIALAATLTSILPGAHAQLPTLVLSNKWALAAGSHWDLDTGNLTRGIAINKLTGNVLLASRTSSNHVSVISGVDGSDLGALNSTGFGVGTLPLVLVRVADDGAIYAANLTAGTSALTIYRWNSESDGFINPPTIVFGPAAPGPATTQRYGDSMDIRGGGTNTQILMSGSGSTVYSVFTTTDGTNFTATELTHNLGAGELGKGITFDGTNNALYGKKDGSVIIHKVAFDLATSTSTLITNITVTGDANTVGTKYGSSNGVVFVSAVLTANSSATNATSHRMKVYTVNNPAAPVTSADFAFPQPYTANGNVIGSSDIANGMVVGVDVNSGVIALTMSFKTNVAPSILTQPQDQTNVLTGGYATFSVAANGTTPLAYQWRFNLTNVIAGATNSALTLTNLQAANAGLYNCVVTNAAGSVTSSPAALGLAPSVLSSAMVPIWSKSIGDLFFLVNDNTHRGLGFNPVTGHLIVVSRSPSNGVHVVNAANGAYVSSLDMSAVIVPNATFPISLGGVAADGAIYAANLDINGTAYTLYRWANENPATVATVAYGPADPGAGGRLGDTLAVRGAGANTQILIGSRDLTTVILFTTTDGLNFTPNVIDVSTEPAGLAGLGIAFGAGDTFWTKSSAYQFRHIAFDLTAGTNVLLQTFASGQNTVWGMGVDPVNDLIGGTSLATPDNLQLIDVHDVVTGAAAEPTLIDQDFFKTDNENGNGTGAVVFDVAGGRVFALDTNNGLLALNVVARLRQSMSGANVVLTWTGPSALQSATSVLGPFTDVGGASSPYTTAPTGAAKFFRLRR